MDIQKLLLYNTVSNHKNRIRNRQLLFFLIHKKRPANNFPKFNLEIASISNHSFKSMLQNPKDQADS